MSTYQRPPARPFPEERDYLGKGRIAAHCARRRYGLLPDQDEMNDLTQQAAATYWYRLEVAGDPPPRAWVQARDRTSSYYFRKMRGVHNPDYLREIHLTYLDDPINNDDRALADVIAAEDTAEEGRLIRLSDDDLRQALIAGRRAAGVDNQKITYALNGGTVDAEIKIIRMSALGYTNAGIAHELGTTEGTVKNRRVRLRRWLSALADELGASVEEWSKTGGDQRHASRIQGAYRGGRKPEAGHA